MKNAVIKIYNLFGIPAGLIHEVMRILFLVIFRIRFKSECALNKQWQLRIRIHTPFIEKKWQFLLVAFAPSVTAVAIPILCIIKLLPLFILGYWLMYFNRFLPSPIDWKEIQNYKSKCLIH